jgi:DEAD/DEAH box helicase domain-containing protein
MCDVRDVGLAFGQGDDAPGETTPVGARTAVPESLGDEPRIYLYDAFPGGIGFSAPLHGMHAELLEGTRQLIAGCDCDHGCPTCVGPIGETGPRAKTVALAILQTLLARPIGDGETAAFPPHDRAAVVARSAEVLAKAEIPF